MAITNRYEGDLLELAKKYGIENYTLGQDFNSHKGKMSASDYDLSNKLLNYYNQEKAAIDQHNAAVQKIDDNAKKQIEDAQINRTKATHYLQNYNKANGLGGLGVAQSSLIDLYNNYQNQRAGIMGQANSNKLDLESAYKKDSNSLYNQYSGEVDEQKKSYSSIAYENAYAGLVSKLEEMIGEDGKVSQEDLNKIKTWAEKNKADLVGEDLYQFEKDIEAIQVRNEKEEFGREYISTDEDEGYENSSSLSRTFMLINKGKLPQNGDTFKMNGKEFLYKDGVWYLKN